VPTWRGGLWLILGQLKAPKRLAGLSAGHLSPQARKTADHQIGDFSG
jgi:hypothetical protein